MQPFQGCDLFRAVTLRRNPGLNYPNPFRILPPQADNSGVNPPNSFVTPDFSPGAEPFPPYVTAVWVVRVKQAKAEIAKAESRNGEGHMAVRTPLSDFSVSVFQRLWLVTLS
jgi:hypothetical protein